MEAVNVSLVDVLPPSLGNSTGTYHFLSLPLVREGVGADADDDASCRGEEVSAGSPRSSDQCGGMNVIVLAS